MDVLDTQLRQWSAKLRDDLGVGAEASNSLASTIAGEVRVLPPETKALLREGTGVALKDRLDELVAFQRWVDVIRTLPSDPVLTRAHVITQNYVCFVYLGDTCFKELRRRAPSGSATRRCSAFLTDNPVRAFRNAVAHGNWRYLPDYSGLEFWARKGAEQGEPMVRWEVRQQDLNFWQALSRCTAYAAYLALSE